MFKPVYKCEKCVEVLTGREICDSQGMCPKCGHVGLTVGPRAIVSYIVEAVEVVEQEPEHGGKTSAFLERIGWRLMTIGLGLGMLALTIKAMGG